MGSGIDSEDESEDDNEEESDWFAYFMKNYEFQVTQAGEVLAEEKAKTQKRRNKKKITEQELKYKCLKEHKDILTTLQEMREEVSNEKWTNIKQDMEYFLENPEDDDI